MKNGLDKQEEIAANELSGEFLKTAKRHISNCRSCLYRMKNGMELLKSNSTVERAFRLNEQSNADAAT